MTDGLRGTEAFRTASWAAWRGTPVDLVVDMKVQEKISSVAVGSFRNQLDNIFLPERLVVAVSTDGVNYTEVASQKYEVEQEAPNCLVDITLTFPETAARYVKVTVTPLASAYAFVDEIIVK